MGFLPPVEVASVADAVVLPEVDAAKPQARIIYGECLQAMRRMKSNSVDAVITDPPYGISFDQQAWDKAIPAVEVWQECYRVLKPGGNLVVFGATRTFHRIWCSIEDAGFEFRDFLLWFYGNSGYPHSVDVSKSVDVAVGAEREEVVNKQRIGYSRDHRMNPNKVRMTKANTPASEVGLAWQGWGTGLRPAWEPIYFGRKLLEGTVGDNVVAYGTGGLNVKACEQDYTVNGRIEKRYPGNIIYTGNDPEVEAAMGADARQLCRICYSPKINRAGRNGSSHPTIKPLPVMEWLCRLAVPPGGTVLDPYAGTGTTGLAACLLGQRPILIEREAVFVEDILNRLSMYPCKLTRNK